MTDVLDAPKTAPAATPPLPAAPAAAPATPPASTAANPYEDVDSIFTKAGIAEAPDKSKVVEPAKGATPKGDKTTPPAKPSTGKERVVPKDVRENWEAETNRREAETNRLKTELKAKTDSHAALETKIKDYESKGKDAEALIAQLETERKEKEQLKADLRRARKEVDPEFVKTYETPFQEMSGEARSAIRTIQVEDPDTDEVRQGDWNSFVKLYGYNEFLATKEAKKLFGEDGAAVVMRYYQELHRLDKAKTRALNEVHAKWKEEETAEQAKAVEEKTRAQQNQEKVNQFWTKINTDLAEKVEDYHDSPDDKELVDLRTKALSKYDEPAKTFQDQIIKDAHNRQRVAASFVLKVKLQRALKELAESKAELDGVKEKPPGRGLKTGGEGVKPAEESYEEYIRKSVTA